MYYRCKPTGSYGITNSHCIVSLSNSEGKYAIARVITLLPTHNNYRVETSHSTIYTTGYEVCRSDFTPFQTIKEL